MARASMNTLMTAVSDPRTACSLTTRQNAEIWRHSVSRLESDVPAGLATISASHPVISSSPRPPWTRLGSSAGSASAITAARSGFGAMMRAVAMRSPSTTSTRDCPVATTCSSAVRIGEPSGCTARRRRRLTIVPLPGGRIGMHRSSNNSKAALRWWRSCRRYSSSAFTALARRSIAAESCGTSSENVTAESSMRGGDDVRPF